LKGEGANLVCFSRAFLSSNFAAGGEIRVMQVLNSLPNLRESDLPLLRHFNEKRCRQGTGSGIIIDAYILVCLMFTGCGVDENPIG
jgi:hypothetical protein